MHLKSLVLKGFKSFADRSVMPFEPGITAVVGPNGSGKSNISDAVLWVLGERSARNLRGQAMEDVIFSGSSARKPTGMAEVSLVLDNSDGTLPVEFNEVSLTRRMYRDGESEYLINGSQARRMDFMDILHDSGLGTDTHSIISQGHLSSILQSRPEDRRSLIEEAAGVLKHKQRKEKSQRKLDLMDNHLVRVRDIVKEVERQAKPLERKAKRALEYQDASSQLAVLELELAVDDLRMLQAKWDEAVSAEKQAEAAVANLKETINQREREASLLQEQLKQFTSGAGELAGRYKRAQAATERLDAKVLLFREKKNSTANYLSEMQISLEQDARAAEAARAQLESAVSNFNEAQAANESARAAQGAAQARADESRQAQRKLQQEIDALSHKRRDAQDEWEETRVVLARTQEVLMDNRAQSQLVEGQAASLQARIDEACEVQNAAHEALESAKSALEQAQANEARQREETGNALHARDGARAAFDAAREQRASLGARVKTLEEAQRSRRSLNPLLSWALSEENASQYQANSLVSVISAPAKLEVLVEQLLDRDIEVLLMQDAQELISLARQLKGREETGFISLISESDAVGSVQPCPDDARRLIDELSFDARYAGAVNKLLGSVLVFPSLSHALDFSQVHPGFTCACEDGFILWANGKLTCQRKRDDEAGKLADYRALEGARGDLANAETEAKDCETKLQDAEAALRATQAKGLELSQTVAQLKGGMNAAAREFERASKVCSDLDQERVKLEQRKTRIAAQLAKAEPDVAGLQAQLNRLTEDIEAFKEQIDGKRGEMAPARALADAASADLNEAKLSCAKCAERLAYAKRMKESCERDIRIADEKAQRIREGMAKKRAAALRIDPLIEIMGILASRARSCAETLELESLRSQDASESLSTSIDKARGAIRAAHDAHDEQASRLATIRVEKSRIGVQVEAAIETIQKDCDTPLETALEMSALDTREETQAQAEKLRRRIANMGTINPDAAQEYEKLKVRLDYLHAQYDDMMAARRSLSKIVAVIDARMRDDFANTFDEVNSNFKAIFSELFPGGHGSLSLVNPEDMEKTGVEVNAQPPGKRILKMSLMSGGEKSLTAMALLFAVYRTRATPFYILDEVEAALDDTNLRRLVAYLNKLRDNSQFIVITHQRRTMEMADVLYGISMGNDGVTKVMSQRLEKALQYAEG